MTLERFLHSAHKLLKSLPKESNLPADFPTETGENPDNFRQFWAYRAEVDTA